MEVKRPIFVDFSIFNQIYFPEMVFFTICRHFVTHQEVFNLLSYVHIPNNLIICTM